MLLSQENLKLKKNEIPTWGLSLVPAKENSFGVNLCINSNIDCRNACIVFKLKKNQPLPTVWKGFEVINGDESDQRLKNVEGTGKIIALRYKNPIAKGSAKYKPSKFIVEL